jgi:hypothetical protein
MYGYLNRVQSSRRLERECQRNIELIWLTGRLAPDFKTIADFRKDNGGAIAKVCREFVMLCRKLGLLSVASVAIDGSKFKAVNAREKNFTEAKMKRRLERIEASIARYLSQLETADRQGEAVPEARVARLKDRIAKLKEETERLNAINAKMMKSEDKQVSLTDPDARAMAPGGRRPKVAGALVDQRRLGPAQRMRTVERWIEADLLQPGIEQPRILAGCSYRLSPAAAGEQISRNVPARIPEIGIHRLAGVLGRLEHHRPAGLLLAHGRAGNGEALRRNVGDPQGDQVAAAQLAVDAEVEQRQIADAAGQLQCIADGPDMFQPQRRFGADQLAPVPGHAAWRGCG